MGRCVLEKPRNDGVFGDVIGDVFLGVISPHLLLVDIFLEDMAENVGIDFAPVSTFDGAGIERPFVLIKKTEDALKRGICDCDSVAICFERMRLKQAAIKIGNVAEQFGRLSVARIPRGSKAAVK